jgi:hypothetical protein
MSDGRGCFEPLLPRRWGRRHAVSGGLAHRPFGRRPRREFAGGKAHTGVGRLLNNRVRGLGGRGGDVDRLDRLRRDWRGHEGGEHRPPHGGSGGTGAGSAGTACQAVEGATGADGETVAGPGAAGFWWQSRIAPGQDYLTAVLGPVVLISLGGGLLNTPLTVTVTSRNG